MKTSLSLLFSLPLISLYAAPTSRPNIIFFLVDDMGWQETSVPFYQTPTPLNHRYRTPNMERLAARGVKFTDAYACAVSSPSRCSLLSGMNAARHRVTNWTLERNTSTDEPSSLITPPAWHVNGIQPAPDSLHTPLSTPITPLPRLLQEQGYYTIHCGKAHFGARHTPGADPTNFGFDINIAGGANGAPASYLAQEDYGKGRFHVEGLEDYYDKGTFLTEALTLEALKALDTPIRRHQPFFLYMAQYAIHVPYDADPRFTPHYTAPDGKGRRDKFLKAPLSPQEINHAALIEGMDKSLGDLLHYLDQRPEVARNTIIIFMSDNGGQSVYVRQGDAQRQSNYPLRAGKGSAFLGGVREPLIISWPGVTHGGNINRNPVMIEDFFPTLLEMAGVKRAHTLQPIDGRSIVPLLRYPYLQRRRPILFHYPNLWLPTTNEADGFGPYSALIDGAYHLIYFWDTGTFRLFNIQADISERHDLCAEQPRLLRQMAQRLTRMLQRHKAQRPTSKATKAPMPWPSQAVRHFHPLPPELRFLHPNDYAAGEQL